MSPLARLPYSVSKWADPFILCATTLVAYWAFSRAPISNLVLAAAIVGAASSVMTLLEWVRLPVVAQRQPLSKIFSHSVTTWLGTLAGLALTCALWGTLAIYRDAYYAPFFDILPLILIATPVLSALFILAAESLLGPSVQGGYQLGLVLLGRTREVNWHLVRDNLLMWLLRGFFLPINFCELVRAMGVFRGHELSLLQGSWVAGEYYALIMIYALIIAAVTPGYLFGARLIGTETKAISSTWFAWVVTLACYAPFEVVVFKNWFNYNPVAASPVWFQPWVQHLQHLPAVLETVGGAIILFALIHLWAEAQFGLRSSNISNRGIITTGAYRFCKHPVYATKCAVWFLLWMPFVSGTTAFDSLRLTFLFACVCGIYILRALAEEKLLSADPDYVSYALWMDEHGTFKFLGSLFPPLRFAWRLAYWQKLR